MQLKWLIAAVTLVIVSRPVRRHDHGRHVVPERADQCLQGGVREEVSERQARDLNKGTRPASPYVRDRLPAAAPRSSGVGARRLRGAVVGQAAEKVDVPTRGIPDKIGSSINDPEGLYRGQALAGYGLMWNTRYLQAHKLAAPKEWADLTKAVYHGHVATSSPSRSGTTHLTFETILQGEGWDKGWNQILQIAGNCAAVTERSFGVPDGVQNGQFGIGLVIDFFGLAAKASGFR
jgi:hypothetical protein